MSSQWLFLFPLVGAAIAAPSVEWRGQFRIAYDNNPFLYSASDLELFRLRAAPSRFPIRTADDLEADMGFGLACRFRLAERGGSLGLRTRLHQYVSNPEKSYGLATVEAGQSIWQSGRLNFAYTYLPDYLIRYYRNPASSDTTDYVGCWFTEHLVTVSFRQRQGNAALQPTYRYEVDDYTPAFDHYDTRAHRMGAELGWDPLVNVGVSAGYEYKLASAKGPVPDISYRQHELGLRVLSTPRKLNRFSFEAGYTFSRRAFTTRNSGDVDPSHAGRVDIIEAVDVKGRYRLALVSLEVGYHFEWRGVTSPHASAIQDVKDYRAGRLSLGAVMSGKSR